MLGSVIGGVSGLVVGGTLVGLFWHDVAATIRKLARRLFKRDEQQINFEILLQ
jgi:uncharacterized membrane protein YciS (DUF1049 family)